MDRARSLRRRRRGKGTLEDGDPLTPAALDTFAVRVFPSAATCGKLEAAKWTVEPAEGRRAWSRARAAAPSSGSRRGDAPGRGARCGERRGRRRRGRGRAGRRPRRLGRRRRGQPRRAASAGSTSPATAARRRASRWRRAGWPDSIRTARSPSSASPARAPRSRKACWDATAASLRQGGSTYLPQVLRLKRIASARRRAEEERGRRRPGQRRRQRPHLLRRGARMRHLPGDCGRPRKSASAAARGARRELRRTRRSPEAAAPGAPVFVTEYFDPTHDSDGDFCRHSLGFTSQAESQWAYERLLRPLNGKIETAAVRNDWTRIADIAADFERARDLRRPALGAELRRVDLLAGRLARDAAPERRRPAADRAAGGERNRDSARLCEAAGGSEGEEEGDKWTKEDWIATGVAAVVPQAVVGASLSSSDGSSPGATRSPST